MSVSKPAIIDDKSPHVIPFILRQLSLFRTTCPSPRPFILALNGVQGAGKTTLVSALSSILNAQGHRTLVLSIDDLYLSHADQTALTAAHPLNPLVQHRGEPGTHDIPLATSVFEKLKAGKEVQVPEYDKSAYNGRGDRVPRELWKSVNREGEEKIQVVIFEGWCVGFRSLSPSLVIEKQKEKAETLGRHRLEDLLFVNERLGEYEVLNESFDALVHIDAEETGFVYAWRQEQEEALRREKGAGMSREEVVRFVDGYFPAYELFTEQLREGLFKGVEGGEGRQLRLVVGRDRRVKQVIEI